MITLKDAAFPAPICSGDKVDIFVRLPLEHTVTHEVVEADALDDSTRRRLRFGYFGFGATVTGCAWRQ